MRAFALLGGACLPLLVSAVACDDVTKPPFLPEASPTVTAEATPTVAATPGVTPTDIDSFRAFARQIEAAVRGRDAAFFVRIAKTSAVICPNRFEPRCERQPDGTQIEGIWTGLWRSEGMILRIDDFRISTEQYLRSLKTPALYAIAALNRDVGGLIGGPAAFAVVASTDSLQSTVRIFEFVEVDGSWRMSSVIQVTNLAKEWLSGECGECYDHWERWEGTP